MKEVSQEEFHKEINKINFIVEKNDKEGFPIIFTFKDIKTESIIGKVLDFSVGFEINKRYYLL